MVAASVVAVVVVASARRRLEKRIYIPLPDLVCDRTSCLPQAALHSAYCILHLASILQASCIMRAFFLRFGGHVGVEEGNVPAAPP